MKNAVIKIYNFFGYHKNLSPTGLRLLVLTFALFGFLLGALPYQRWQIANEGAQALAGIIPYATDNPFFLFHMKSWTILHQFGVLWYKVGLDEWAYSILLSGLMGASFFVGALLALLSATGNPWLSSTGAGFLFACRSHLTGINYNIHLVGTGNTYGTLANNLSFLALSAIVAGWVRTGWFVVGLLPSVHLTWGLWTLGIAVLFHLLNRKDSQFSKCLYLGLGITLVSFLMHQLSLQNYHYGPINGDILKAFIKYQDPHRVPASLLSWKYYYHWTILGVGLFLLAQKLNPLPHRAKVLVKLVLLSTLLSIALSLFNNIYSRYVFALDAPFGWFTRYFIALIPGRFLNLNLYFFIPLLLTLLCWRPSATRRHWFIQLPLLIFVFGFGLKSIYSQISYTSWGLTTGTYTFKRPAHFFDIAGGSQDLLLAAPGTHLLPTIVRRPILLDPDSIDYIPFIPQLAEPTNRVASDLYGSDLLQSKAKDGQIQDIVVQEAWEKRSNEDWIRLAQNYGFKQVLAPNQWKLLLPRERVNQVWTLYNVDVVRN